MHFFMPFSFSSCSSLSACLVFINGDRLTLLWLRWSNTECLKNSGFIRAMEAAIRLHGTWGSWNGSLQWNTTCRICVFWSFRVYDRLFGVATDCHFYYLIVCVFSGVAILVISYVVCAWAVPWVCFSRRCTMECWSPLVLTELQTF